MFKGYFFETEIIDNVVFLYRSSVVDQSSLDHSERISVCSREEGERLVEVAVGNLIDVSSELGMYIQKCVQ